MLPNNTIMGLIDIEVKIGPEVSPYPHLPIYTALMMCHGGGVDLEATTAAKLEKKVRRYIWHYEPEDPSDIVWNREILCAVEERRFCKYGRGSVRAKWPNEADGRMP